MNARYLFAALCLGTAVAGLAELPPFYPELAPEHAFDSALTPPNEIAVNGVKPATFTRLRSLNGKEWKILPPVNSAVPFPDSIDLDKGYQAPNFDDSAWDSIPVPLDWNRQYSGVYSQKQPYVKGFYRRSFELTPAELSGRRVLLRFGVIGYDGTVFVNGRKIGRHKGDFTPCEFDVTDAVRPGRNVLAIRVLSDFGTVHGNIPAAGHVYGSQWGWGNIKAGLWQSVELAFVPEIYLESLRISPLLAEKSIRIDYTLDNRSGKEFHGTLAFAALPARKGESGRAIGEISLPVSLKAGAGSGSVKLKLRNPVEWSPEHPCLYYLAATVSAGGKAVSGAVERFGFREFKIIDGKFHLNGKRIYLFGENIRSVDFGGRGTTPEEDRKNLHHYLVGFKRQGVNIVRNAHLPILPAALEIADEIGLMIYNEWGWSFTNTIDEPLFQRNNDRELLEWAQRDYNHPSVVMWSGANEVRHRDRADVKRQLDRQVDLLRKFDLSGRPVGSFSGSASWSSYGTEALNTDFLDLHSYFGLSAGSWTIWNRTIDRMYEESLKHYGATGNTLPFPYIIWECVGFTWGAKYDKNFRLNDMQSYAKYARGETSWAQGNGIGYAATIGLAAALDPRRGMDYGKALFGHRLLEQVRQNPRIDGFAPWQHATHFRPATLWNQPVLAGIRNAAGLPPSNLFAGGEESREFFVVNSTNLPVKNATAAIRLLTEDRKELPLAEITGLSLPPWETTVRPLRLKLPDIAPGHAQLRVVLKGADGRELSRNFYNVYLGDRSLLHRPIQSREKLALIDFGRVQELRNILKQLSVPFTVIPVEKLDRTCSAAIIPSGIEGQSHRFKTGELERWMKDGGKPLVLEQPTGVSGILPGVRLVNSPLPFADLVFPAHPVFSGLDQRNFDLWENPREGRVISTALSPFTTNALAVRGPLLGSRNVENAVTEARIGRGRIFWSQLDAVALWGRDSSATRYLRNVLEYMLSGSKPYEKVTELERDSTATYSIPGGREKFIALEPYANRGFRDDGDGTGWTGQGINDFRNVPLAVQSVNGVRFRIIDPAANHGRSCLILRGSDKPEFPARIEGISIDAKVSRLFFLHTSAWKGNEAGYYRIHYENGETLDYPLIQGKNIGDWWNVGKLSDALPGLTCSNALTETVGTYMAVWENPYPEKKITKLDFLAAGQNRAIDYLPGRAPVPILLAITAERTADSPLPVAAEWRGSGRGGIAAPEITRAAGVTRIAFPAVDKPEKEAFSFAMAKFDATRFDPARHQRLVLTIKHDQPGALDLSIPERNWNGTLRYQLELDDRTGEFRRYRIDLLPQLTSLLKGKALRGELFLYNGEDKHAFFPRPAVTVELKEVWFE